MDQKIALYLHFIQKRSLALLESNHIRDMYECDKYVKLGVVNSAPFLFEYFEHLCLKKLNYKPLAVLF
jgi:hypothetical protein